MKLAYGDVSAIKKTINVVKYLLDLKINFQK